MNEIASQLHKLRLRFVERAVVQLTRGEGLRQLAAEQITRFYSLLEDAVESGNPEWLDSCLQDWVNARSRSAFGERLTLLPVLDKLKATAWDVVRENCPPQQSLDVIVAMELSFVHAQSFVAVLEVDALLQETAARLHEAQANLRRLEKSKSSFIAVAAHELKTPLTLIEGYADMLTDELKTGGAGTGFLIGGIAKGIVRLREIVDDMIDVSMIDNHMLTLAYQPARLLKMVERVRDSLENALRDRRIEFNSSDFSVGEEVVLVDPQRMLQVFRQVILNAVK